MNVNPYKTALLIIIDMSIDFLLLQCFRARESVAGIGYPHALDLVKHGVCFIAVNRLGAIGIILGAISFYANQKGAFGVQRKFWMV